MTGKTPLVEGELKMEAPRPPEGGLKMENGKWKIELCRIST